MKYPAHPSCGQRTMLEKNCPTPSAMCIRPLPSVVKRFAAFCGRYATKNTRNASPPHLRSFFGIPVSLHRVVFRIVELERYSRTNHSVEFPISCRSGAVAAGHARMPGVLDGEHTYYTPRAAPRRRTPDPGGGVPGSAHAAAGRGSRPGHVAGVRAHEPGTPGAPSGS